MCGKGFALFQSSTCTKGGTTPASISGGADVGHKAKGET